jgi:hypothetical protein
MWGAQFTAVLASKGVRIKPFSLNYSTPASDIILAIMATEAAANFDYWQRSGMDDTNRRQDFWPPLLRLARMIPAVEYIQVQTSAVPCTCSALVTGIASVASLCLILHAYCEGAPAHAEVMPLALPTEQCSMRVLTGLVAAVRLSSAGCGGAQAQRARSMLVKEVIGLMDAAGIDAFIGNTSEELAMANLVSLPTVVSTNPNSAPVLVYLLWSHSARPSLLVCVHGWHLERQALRGTNVVLQAVPIGLKPLPNAGNSTRRQVMSLGIFGAPLSDPKVRTFPTHSLAVYFPISKRIPWCQDHCQHAAHRA